MHGENPARAADAALIGDLPLVEIAANRFQRNQHITCGNHQLEMRADMFIEGLKTFAQAHVIVKWQSARMRIEPKCAERASQTRHFDEKLLGMLALGKTGVAQYAESGVDCVHKPERGDVVGRESGLKFRRRPTRAGKRSAFFVENL